MVDKTVKMTLQLQSDDIQICISVDSSTFGLTSDTWQPSTALHAELARLAMTSESVIENAINVDNKDWLQSAELPGFFAPCGIVLRTAQKY